MKRSFSTASAAERFFEDQLYERVYEEIESGQMDKAAQARAIAEGGGDDGAVKRAYIKHRMDRIKAELIAEEQAAQERAKAEAQAQKARQDAEFAKQQEIDKQERRQRRRESVATVKKVVLVAFTIYGVFTVLAILIAISSNI